MNPADQKQMAAPAGAQLIRDEFGQFYGGNFEIRHRDTNTILILNLQGEVHAKPGTMISYTQGVVIRGTFHFTFKNIFTGDQTAYLHLRGPGQATLSNHGLGDIIVLYMNNSQWITNRNAFLCMTDGIQRDSKAQSIGKTFMSGAGLWVHHYTGTGTLFLETFGAILFQDLQPGENYFIHHHFVVAWNCQYGVETIKAEGGFFSKLATGDFWMCRFTGPGRVYFQSKSADVFGEWISPYIPQKGN
ncbi:hypothetical protein SmJEL517_g01948 [Synchytrium microbalum]|uniref:Altered inheritance of mitochondria protein 24, mitochondrial n=1 Tax=Synchytrium microbalum TaxID=1806994 RepID=A0A507CDM7_9FUNG|nr:uncharacterized protein SmJEL517_g01948 [Synchytrium microbalum]TPX35665.1 hypothetical protein SmJEL517_g01948 [Synchytrium microbalum]